MERRAASTSIAIEFRFANGHFERVPELVADLVRRQVSVIAIPNTTASAVAAKAATQTIPFVFSLGSNPVEVGLQLIEWREFAVGVREVADGRTMS
jgi:ABC-type uncharacterized transport system substrate-binding protein